MNSIMGNDSVFHLREDLWEDIQEYKEDYKYVIKYREFQRVPFRHQSPQIQHRKNLVTYLKKIAVQKRMSHCCLHLSIYLLDIFMDNHSIDYEKIYLVANVCLFIASKMEESNNSVVKISELNTAIGKAFTVGDYKALELFILEFFNWFVMFPTTATYTHYYIQAAISKKEMDFLENIMQERARGVLLELNAKIRIYLDKIIDDVHFMQFYKPSLLAASVIAAARLRLGLHTWNNDLQNLTDYCVEDIEDCLKNLLRLEKFACSLCNRRNY